MYWILFKSRKSFIHLTLAILIPSAILDCFYQLGGQFRCEEGWNDQHVRRPRQHQRPGTALPTPTPTPSPTPTPNPLSTFTNLFMIVTRWSSSKWAKQIVNPRPSACFLFFIPNDLFHVTVWLTFSFPSGVTQIFAFEVAFLKFWLFWAIARYSTKVDFGGVLTAELRCWKRSVRYLLHNSRPFLGARVRFRDSFRTLFTAML